MHYFIDCEFIDTGREIELISIGIIDENNRSYYAISTDFNEKKASQWVKDNVLAQLPPKNPTLVSEGGSPRLWEESKAWKSNQQIRRDILKFFIEPEYGSGTLSSPSDITVLNNSFEYKYKNKKYKPEIWAYYGAYDYVVFCQLMCSRPKQFKNNFQKLFSRNNQSYNPMVDGYPKFLPYYFREIKQLCDHLGNPQLPQQEEGKHNALSDAKHNKFMYEYLQKMKLPTDNF